MTMQSEQRQENFKMPNTVGEALNLVADDLINLKNEIVTAKVNSIRNTSDWNDFIDTYGGENFQLSPDVVPYYVCSDAIPDLAFLALDVFGISDIRTQIAARINADSMNQTLQNERHVVRDNSAEVNAEVVDIHQFPDLLTFAQMSIAWLDGKTISDSAFYEKFRPNHTIGEWKAIMKYHKENREL